MMGLAPMTLPAMSLPYASASKESELHTSTDRDRGLIHVRIMVIIRICVEGLRLANGFNGGRCTYYVDRFFK